MEKKLKHLLLFISFFAVFIYTFSCPNLLSADPIWDFETFNDNIVLGDWDSKTTAGTCDVTLDTTIFFQGTGSYVADKADGSVSTCYVQKDLASGDTWERVRFWFRFDVLPSNNNYSWLRLVGTTPTSRTHQSFVNLTSGAVRVFNAAVPAFYDSTNTMSAGTWYDVEITVKYDNSTGSIEVKVNGTTWITRTNIDTLNLDSVAANRVEVGWDSSLKNVDVWFDHFRWAVQNTDPGEQTNPTVTPTATPTDTPTPTNTPTPTPTPNATNTPAPGPTSTPGPTATNTPTPTATSTPVPTVTPVLFIVPTYIPTPSPTPLLFILPSYIPPTEEPWIDNHGGDTLIGDLTKKVNQNLSNATSQVAATINNLRQNETVLNTAKTASSVAAASSLLVMTPGVTHIIILSSSIATTSGVTAIPQSLFSTLGEFLAVAVSGEYLRRARRKTWGLVYNSATKTPISGALVVLYSSSGNLYTTFTNKNGRFGFLPEKEDVYKIRVEKNGFIFPSKIVKTTSDGDIKHIYQDGQTFNITQKNPDVVVSVPIDPKHLKWNFFYENLKIKIGFLWDNLAVYLLFGLLLLSTFSLMLFPNLLNSALFVFYLFITSLNIRERFIKSTSWGLVQNNYGKRISQVILTLYSASSRWEKQDFYTSTSTNGRGRYQLIPEYGKYILVISHPQIKSYHLKVEVTPNQPYINTHFIVETAILEE